MGIAALILGLIGIVAWLIPFFGFPFNILAIIFGAVGRNSSNPGMAKAGLILGIIGLVLTIINAILGVLLLL